jgi:putative transposase
MFGKGFAHRVKAARRKPGSTWHLDEMFVTLRGEPYLLWRAVDEHGAELDILVQKRRDKAAAKRFFKRVLRSSPVPRKIVTDQLRSYPAAKAEIPELANVKHVFDVFVKAAARLNNRAEIATNRRANASVASHGDFLRGVRGFRDPKRTQKFLSCFGPIRQHFALKRHLLRASLYRKQLAARFVAWHEFAELAQNPSTAF